MQKFLSVKNYKVILIALLAGITIFSVYKYTQALREKYALLNTLNEVKGQVAALEIEKQNLLQALEKERQSGRQLIETKSKLKENLGAGVRKITKLNSELDKIKTNLGQLNSAVAALKDENISLKEEKDKLTQEKDGLQARLSSIIELRKAIRELKRQVHKVGAGIREQNESAQGNQGFVIKDGKSTTTTKVTIEVAPAPPEQARSAPKLK